MELLRNFKSVLGAQNEDPEQTGSETVRSSELLVIYSVNLNCICDCHYVACLVLYCT